MPGLFDPLTIRDLTLANPIRLSLRAGWVFVSPMDQEENPNFEARNNSDKRSRARESLRCDQVRNGGSPAAIVPLECE